MVDEFVSALAKLWRVIAGAFFMLIKDIKKYNLIYFEL